MKKNSKEKTPEETKEETPQVLNYHKDLKEIKDILIQILDRMHSVNGGFGR